MHTFLKVKGMSCQHCVMSVTKALSQLEGIKNIQVDLAKGEVRFDNTKSVALDQIGKAIKEAGYEAILQSMEQGIALIPEKLYALCAMFC